MEGPVTECTCIFSQFISTMENIVYLIWHFSSSDTFYVFSVMYRAMDERQRHRWRVTDEEITDEESQMKRSQMKSYRWRWDERHRQKSWFQDIWHLTIKVKIKKTTHFTMNVLKRNIRTNFLFVILYIFVVKKRHISMLKVKLYFFSLFLKFCFGRSGAFLCNLWSC